MPRIYSAHEAQTVGDVGLRIPRIYAALGNRKTNHRTSIIEMDSKLDQVVSTLIDPGSNYSYVNAHLVDRCGLNKEVHAEYWLVQLNTGSKKRVHH